MVRDPWTPPSEAVGSLYLPSSRAAPVDPRV